MVYWEQGMTAGGVVVVLAGRNGGRRQPGLLPLLLLLLGVGDRVKRGEFLLLFCFLDDDQ